MIKIQLTQGQQTIIDDEDVDLTELRWCAVIAPNYAGDSAFIALRKVRRTNGERRNERLHRVILSRMLGRELTRREHVDHINGDPLDNRRRNLRLANTAQNSRNRGRPSNNSSGYKGVSWSKRRQRWVAYIYADSTRHHLGYFHTAEEAAHAYDAAARELHGEFARLNFPDIA